MSAGRSVFVLITLLHWLAPACAEDTFPLRWRPQPDALRYRITMERRQEAAPHNVSKLLRWDGDLSITIQERGEPPSVSAEVRFSRIRVREEGPGGHLLYDSSATAAEGVYNRWAIAAGQLLSAKIQVTEIEGRLAHVVLCEEWNNGMAEAVREAGGSAVDMQAVVSVFGAMETRRIMERFFNWVPENARQQPGAVWKMAADVDLQLQVEMIRESNHRFVRVHRDQDGQTALISVSDQLTGNGTDRTYTLPGEMQVRISEFSQNGEISFSRQGYLKRRHDRGSMIVATEPSPGGEPVLKFHLHQEFTIRRIDP